MKHGFRTKRTCCFLFGLLILFLSPHVLPEASAGDLLIICNQDVPDSSLTKSALRNIFIGKKTEWSDGRNKSLPNSLDKEIRRSQQS